MVPKLNSDEVFYFLIMVSIVLISSRLLGEIFRKFRQPVVVGEILAGIIIGPSIFGFAFPDLFRDIFQSQPRSFGAFDGLANIGVTLLMFIAGLEVDIRQIRRQGLQAASVSLLSLIFPFAIGFVSIWFFYDFIFVNSSSSKLIAALFFGTTLSITALTVIARVLMDLDIIRTRVGGLVLTAAMINDLIGWILFSIIIQMMNSKGGEIASFGSVIFVLLFVAFMFTAGKWIVDKILYLSSKYLAPPSGIITVSISLCLLGAVFTEYLGVRGIFGAFLIGVAVGDSKHFNYQIQHIIQQFVLNIIAPLFFASVGLRVNFVANFDLSVVLLILGIACFGKIFGAFIGSRMSGLTKNESMATAFGMNARGSQEIVLGMIALQAGIIDEKIFVGLVVMTMVTILMAGPLMKYYLELQLMQERNLAKADAPVIVVNEAKESLVTGQ